MVSGWDNLSSLSINFFKLIEAYRIARLIVANLTSCS